VPASAGLGLFDSTGVPPMGGPSANQAPATENKPRGSSLDLPVSGIIPAFVLDFGQNTVSGRAAKCR